MARRVDIHTDGACSGNPGPGGWAAILVCDGNEKILQGHEPDTTNNRMELTACIQGLQAIKKSPAPAGAPPLQKGEYSPSTYPTLDITVYSDSSYLVDAINKGWLSKWQSNGWRTSGKDPVKNQDLWERIIGLNAALEPKYVWVRGHSTNEYNNRCDALAVAQSKSQ